MKFDFYFLTSRVKHGESPNQTVCVLSFTVGVTKNAVWTRNPGYQKDRSTDVQFLVFPMSTITTRLLVGKELCRKIFGSSIPHREKSLKCPGSDHRSPLHESLPSLNTAQSELSKRVRNLATVFSILFFYLVRRGLCAYVILHIILPPSPVILRIELGDKPKWLPLKLDTMTLVTYCARPHWKFWEDSAKHDEKLTLNQQCMGKYKRPRFQHNNMWITENVNNRQ